MPRNERSRYPSVLPVPNAEPRSLQQSVERLNQIVGVITGERATGAAGFNTGIDEREGRNDLAGITRQLDRITNLFRVDIDQLKRDMTVVKEAYSIDGIWFKEQNIGGSEPDDLDLLCPFDKGAKALVLAIVQKTENSGFRQSSNVGSVKNEYSVRRDAVVLGNIATYESIIQVNFGNSTATAAATGGSLVDVTNTVAGNHTFRIRNPNNHTMKAFLLVMAFRD